MQTSYSQELFLNYCLKLENSIDKYIVKFTITPATAGLSTNVFNDNDLLNAFEHLVKRHDTLRTVFSINTKLNKIDCSLSNEIRPPLVRINLQNMTKDEYTNIIRMTLKKLNLKNKVSPLVSLIIFSDTNGETLFCFIHHVAIDGMSIKMLKNELCLLLQKRTLPQLNCSYQDYCKWEKKYMDSEEYKISKKWWETQPKNFINDLPYLSTFSSSDQSTVYLSKHDIHKFDILFNKYFKNTFLFTFVTLIFSLMFRQVTKQSKSCLTGAVSSKYRNEAIGVFVNTVNLIYEIKSEWTLYMFFRNGLNHFQNVYYHSDVPYQEINNINPQIMITMDVLQQERDILGIMNSKFDLLIEVKYVKNETFEIYWVYSDGKFSRDTIVSFDLLLNDTINKIFENQNISIGELTEQIKYPDFKFKIQE